MNNKAQADPRLFSHIFLWIFSIGISVYLIYAATHSTTENNKYAPGTNHIEITEHNWPLSLHPCGAIFSFDSLKGNKNDALVNKTVSK